MSNDSLKLGKAGEELAVEFLKTQGYRVMRRNYRNTFGEIDIIAKDKETVCFIEVKTRLSGKCGAPEESVIKRKQTQIGRVALAFLKSNRLLEQKARFDVVSVSPGGQTPCVLIKDAFELSDSFTY